MKLYLSSYGIGDHPEALQKLVGSNKRAAVIVNAQDFTTEPKRAARLAFELDAIKSLGFVAEELDLRDYFNKPAQLAAKLETYGLVWIRGGNVFVLRRAMRQSGFDACIGRLVESEKLVYAGFSAGSCAAAPDLHGIELVDDDTIVPAGYSPEIIWSGLNFVPYAVAPHYRSDHPEAAAIEQAVQYFESHKIPYRALRDGQAIVVNGSRTELAG